MADWNVPILSTQYVACMDDFKNRDLDAARLAESPVNTPSGYIRYNRATNIFEEWSGTAWVAKIIAIAGGGTGATTPSGIISGLGLGTMAFQNSNAVNITGGIIQGLSSLRAGAIFSSGGINSYSGYSVGPEGAPTVVIDSTAKIREDRLHDDTILARVAGNETIIGAWTYAQRIYIRMSNPHIDFYDLDATPDAKIWRLIGTGGSFLLQAYGDNYGSVSTPLIFGRVGAAASTIALACNTSITLSAPAVTVNGTANVNGLSNLNGNVTMNAEEFRAVGISPSLSLTLYQNAAIDRHWRLLASGQYFYLQMSTSDYASTSNPITILRSGVTSVYTIFQSTSLYHRALNNYFTPEDRFQIEQQGNFVYFRWGPANTTAWFLVDGVNIASMTTSAFAVFKELYAANISTAAGTPLVLQSGGYIVKQSSSKRYKEDILDLNLDVEKFITDLNPTTFKYRATTDRKDYAGFIAEDVYSKYPQLTHMNKDDEPESWDKDGMIAYLYKAVQFLYDKIKTYDSENVQALGPRTD